MGLRFYVFDNSRVLIDVFDTLAEALEYIRNHQANDDRNNP